ncbi:MAG: asparagine synthase (glutamine-hydrolyzing) [Betaproteobacteria bacterium]|nr:asparagine synthase (glutamine-hydrolyzing) [Betaproteobacteria bacterium]
MCGIAGLLATRGPGKPLEALAGAMAQRLAHRGPDALGTWADPSAGIAFGHRRLAILDLSPAGAQPMHSHSGRFTIAFNGEIYNHMALRECLEARDGAIDWRGHSDTEVLIEAIERLGLETALREAIGMFALAAWDRETCRLHLARDRFGEKPLYYGRVGHSFAFASELKAFAALPEWNPVLDRDALTLYLRYNCVPSPRSIWAGIAKLSPGMSLSLGTAHTAGGELPAPRAYWSLSEAIAQARAHPFTGSLDEATDELEKVLREAIAGQMLADVPLGAFLSGGIDSSTIVALMQSLTGSPVRTFTLGFRETGYDEAAHARAIATHLGTEHHESTLGASDALAAVPRLAEVFDEPFADSSQLPTLLIATEARRHVTVSLSGDGGDEIFGGYNRYAWVPRLSRGLSHVPSMLRVAAAGAIGALPTHRAARLLGAMPGAPSMTSLQDKVPKLLEALRARDEPALYASVVSHWKTPGNVVKGATEPMSRPLVHPGDAPALTDFRDWMMYTDSLSYLPDDILVKVDRAAMSVGLETRVPYLDPRVVSFAWSLPVDFRAHAASPKRVLRRLLHRHVPPALVERPKAGFAVPLSSWLRGELREWAEALLDPARLGREGIFEPAPIRRAWNEHLSGRRDWHYHLWDILMFQAWHERKRTP